MNITSLRAPLALVLATAAVSASAQGAAPQTPPIKVTADNFVRAETDRYFAGFVKRGGFGKSLQYRDLLPLEVVTVVRLNRDTLYSAGVWDLDAGPVTVTLPDSGKRFRSLAAISQDHYVPPAVTEAGTYTYT